MKTNVTIKRVAFDKETLTVTMEAAVTPELVEEVASLNAKGELEMVLIPVQAALFDSKIATPEVTPGAPAAGPLFDLNTLRDADGKTVDEKIADEATGLPRCQSCGRQAHRATKACFDPACPDYEPLADDAPTNEPTIEPTGDVSPEPESQEKSRKRGKEK